MKLGKVGSNSVFSIFVNITGYINLCLIKLRAFKACEKSV